MNSIGNIILTIDSSNKKPDRTKGMKEYQNMNIYEKRK